MRCLLDTAVRLVDALMAGQPFTLDEHIARARETVETDELGPSTKAVVDAAASRDIPWSRVDENSLVRLDTERTWHDRRARLLALWIDLNGRL
jgi:cyanophycin synthetase